MIWDIDNKYIVFHLNVFSNGPSNEHSQRRPWNIDCKKIIFLVSVFSKALSNKHYERRLCNIFYKDMVFSQVYSKIDIIFISEQVEQTKASFGSREKYTLQIYLLNGPDNFMIHNSFVLTDHSYITQIRLHQVVPPKLLNILL